MASFNFSILLETPPKPDLVLIYKKTEEGELLILKLVRLGSHSELAI